MTSNRSPQSTVRKAASEVDRSKWVALWHRLRARLQNRDDSEHEQILIRIAIGAVAVAYIVFVTDYHGDNWQHAWLGVAIVNGHFLGALALFAALLASPSVHVVRRYIGMMLDNVALTLIMIWGNESTALFYPLYLWVTLGMGFRYGRSYLMASALMTVFGFIAVILLTSSWQEHLPLTLSLLAALLILPAYASTLLDKLTLALNRAEEANRAKSRFLATMSHELRTPLHAIIGMSNLLRTRQLNAEQRQMIDTVNNAGHTLLEMIEDILDVARIETGRLIQDKDDFDLHAILNTVRGLLFHQARAKAIDLFVEIDPNMPFRLRGASRWLKQILINLVGNAIKFTDEGRIVIRLRSEQEGPDEIWLHIDVEDTGVGIPAEATDRIFDRFAQVDESTTRLHGGTGLGLAIAQQFAQRMDGRISVTSTLHEGSCFTFSAPFSLSDDNVATLLDGNVLVVGGDVERFTRRLAAWGANPTIAETWPEALGILDDDKLLRAAILIDPTIDQDYRHFTANVSKRSWSYPTDIIVIGDSLEQDDRPILARLPLDVGDDVFFRAIHAALTIPAILDEDQENQRNLGFRSRNILVAEDNRINRQVIEKMLRVAGHTVTIINDGEDLLDKLDESPDAFDVVVVDLNMPKINGYEALSIHRIAVGDEHAPFIALTADATEDSRRKCLDAGFSGYLTKPVELKELLDLIDKLAFDSSARSEIREVVSTNIVRHPRFEAPRKAIDISRLERLRALDRDDGFFRNVISEFIEDASMLIDELEAAAEAGDCTAFRDRAHALRSSAANLGATALCDLCFGWRDLGTRDLAEHGRRELDLLRAEFDRLRTELQALVDQTNAARQH